MDIINDSKPVMDKKRKIHILPKGDDDDNTAGHFSEVLSSSKKKKKKDDNDEETSTECYKFNRDDPIEMMKCLVHNSMIVNSTVEEPPVTTKEVKTRIVTLKDQMERLLLLKTHLSTFLETTIENLQTKKREEISSLLDATSPLLSLGHTNLSKILDFLDAEDIVSVEVASYTLNQVIFENYHWKRIIASSKYKHQKIPLLEYENIPMKYQYRPPRFKFLLPPPKIEGNHPPPHQLTEEHQQQQQQQAQIRYFGIMSRKAKYYEELGEIHYDYYQDFQDNESRHLTIHCNGCDIFRSGGIILRKNRHNKKLFVRLSLYEPPHHNNNNTTTTTITTATTTTNIISSRDDDGNTTGRHRSKHKLVWQGFCNGIESRIATITGDVHVQIDLSRHIRNMDWPELKELHTEVAGRSTQARHLFDDRIQPLVQNLRVTVLLTEDQPPLLVTGGIFRGSFGGTVYLHPRNDSIVYDDNDKPTNKHATFIGPTPNRVNSFLGFPGRGMVLVVTKG